MFGALLLLRAYDELKRDSAARFVAVIVTPRVAAARTFARTLRTAIATTRNAAAAAALEASVVCYDDNASRPALPPPDRPLFLVTTVDSAHWHRDAAHGASCVVFVRRAPLACVRAWRAFTRSPRQDEIALTMVHLFAGSTLGDGRALAAETLAHWLRDTPRVLALDQVRAAPARARRRPTAPRTRT